MAKVVPRGLTMGSRMDSVVGFVVVVFDVWEVWWFRVVWMIVPRRMGFLFQRKRCIFPVGIRQGHSPFSISGNFRTRCGAWA